MLAEFNTILECSRVFALPMTVMSWVVIFTYTIFGSGNALYGILALIGISFAHLGTNVLDDFFDYKFLIKQVNFDKKEYLQKTQNTKCRYLVSGILSEKEVLSIALIYFAAAGLIGLFFLIKCGIGVLYFGLIGGLIALLYSFMSRIKLSEIAVGLAYGPVLFCGVYYVMTKTFSWDAIILAIPTMFITITLLYVHTVMDYEYDLGENKQTVANSFDSQLDSLVVLKAFLILAYASLFPLCIFDILDWQVFLVLITIPIAVDLYNSMVSYSTDQASIPDKKWFHFPMENMNRLKSLDAQSFMVRMYLSRNLMIYFSTILTVAVILGCI